MSDESWDCGLLRSSNDVLQAFESVVLCLLSAGHGPKDGHFLAIDIGEQESNLCSHICLMGVLEITFNRSILRKTASAILTLTGTPRKGLGELYS